MTRGSKTHFEFLLMQIIERIKAGVLQGGHDMLEDKVHSRYGRVMALLPEYVSLADSALVYDNSDVPRTVLGKRDGEVELIGDVPEWLLPTAETLGLL